MTILVLADHDGTSLNPATHAAIAAARQIDDQVHLLIAGHAIDGLAQSATHLGGIAHILVADDPALRDGLAENLAPLIAALMQDHDVFLTAATTRGKNVAPRVAALLDVGQISDIIAVEAPDIFVRPIYGGQAQATVRSLDAKRVITIRPTVFPALPDAPDPVPVTAAPLTPMGGGALDAGLSRFVELRKGAQGDRPDLAAAKIVVSGGRGLGSAEQFKTIIEPLADALHAAVGASRAAVDDGYVSNDRQVGQTGRNVAPDLYIAIGISGAIQHIAGMKDSRTIVAIDKNPDAPIFQIADFGLVGDLFTLVPELTKRLSA